MIHHYITKYEENGRCWVEAWIQINLFGKCFCFSKRKMEIKDPSSNFTVKLDYGKSNKETLKELIKNASDDFIRPVNDEINQFTITKKGSDEIIARIFKDKNDWKAIIDNGYEVTELA